MILDAFYEYGLTRPLSDAGYFPTEKTKRIQDKIKDLALGYGCLIALCGAVGSGKTTFINELMKQLKAERKCTVSYSYSSDRKKVNIKTLLTALLTDLSKGEKSFAISSSPEIRDRRFVKLMEENDKPVVLFIDEAHDLHGNTLSSLKKLIEMAKISQKTLTIIFAGQPKLKHTIQASSLEEVGARAYMIDFDEQGMTQREQYLKWAIGQCIARDREWTDVITPDAVKLLTDKLITPLQIIWHFNRALEIGLDTGIKPINRAIIEGVLKSVSSSQPTETRAPVTSRPLVDAPKAELERPRAATRAKTSPPVTQAVLQTESRPRTDAAPAEPRSRADLPMQPEPRPETRTRIDKPAEPRPMATRPMAPQQNRPVLQKRPIIAQRPSRIIEPIKD